MPEEVEEDPLARAGDGDEMGMVRRHEVSVEDGDDDGHEHEVS